MNWPSDAGISASEPEEIENYLRSVIRDSHVSLIGEIDLTTPTDYAGIGWSLLELANYQMESTAVRDFLSSKPTARKFRASIAIWAVGHAQISDEGGRLWEQLESYSSTQRANIATEFTESMKTLRFDTFEHELKGAQKHVQLASMHALLPDFSIKRFAEIVEVGVRLNRPKHLIFSEITNDPAVSKSIIRLFNARTEMALDLIERAFNFIAYGYELDLPPRLTSRLNRDGSGRRRLGSKEGFPEVHFMENDRRPIVLGGAGWTFSNSNFEEVTIDDFSPEKLYAHKEGRERLLVLDATKGYLVFDDLGRLLHGNRMPEIAGFIMWRNGTKFITDLPDLDTRSLVGQGWEDWSYSYIFRVRNIELQTTVGERVSLSTPLRVEIETFPIPYLLDAEQNPVYWKLPKLVSGEAARISDNIANRQYRANSDELFSGDTKSRRIDFTATNGLGKSTRIRGTLVPDLKILGLENALTKGEERKVKIQAPQGWALTYPADLENQPVGELLVRSDPNQLFEIIEFRDDLGQELTTYLEIPTLTWSIMFTGREFQTMASEATYSIADRGLVESLILHGITEYVPILFVGDLPISGKKRGNDLHFDLRFLSQATEASDTHIFIKWNYKDLSLITFSSPKVSNILIPKKRRDIVLKSFAELDNVELLTTDAELFTVEAWNDYLKARRAEHLLYRDQLRNRRAR